MTHKEALRIVIECALAWSANREERLEESITADTTDEKLEELAENITDIEALEEIRDLKRAVDVLRAKA